MAENAIRAYMMRLGKDDLPCQGYIGEIENTLRAKQRYVGGTIQVIRLTPEIDVVLNDDGKLLGYPVNRLWRDTNTNEPLDFLVGNILCCRHNDEGEFTDIQVEDIEVIERTLKPLTGVAEVEEHIVFITVPAWSLSKWESEEEK